MAEPSKPAPPPPEEPEDLGDFTPQQKALLETRIAANKHDRPCEACGNTDWAIGSSIFQLEGYIGPYIKFRGRPLLPVICLNCQVCGNMRLLNAIGLGLLNPRTGGWIDG